VQAADVAEATGARRAVTSVTSAADVKAEALRIGFVACGVTRLEPNAHGADLDRWLANGYAGTMRYLHRQAKSRKDPRRITPRATTAIVVL
jgi:epoxyqueuosine reductase